MLTDTQYSGLIAKSRIAHVHGLVMILFASYQRAFILDIKQIAALIQSGKKSINIDKIDKWAFAYGEVPTVPNNRKTLLDYTGDFAEIWRAADYDNWNIHDT
jgi:penicillin-binding protein-related factor A (putative recombinase)